MIRFLKIKLQKLKDKVDTYCLFCCNQENTGPPTLHNRVCSPAASLHRPEDMHCNIGETLSYKTFLTRSIPKKDFKNRMDTAAEAYGRIKKISVYSMKIRVILIDLEALTKS